MKTIKNLAILALIAVVSLSTAFTGNSQETQTRNVKNFDGIKVSTGIDLYLTMGSSEEVKIVADEDLIDDIRTDVKDGTLHIYTKKNNWFNWGNNKPRKAYVTVTELTRLYASSGSDVVSENTLEGDRLEVKTSSGSDIKIDVIIKNLSVDASSGSDAKLSGRSKTFEAEASSGSDIKAQNLEAKIGKLRASSGSDISVTITDELYAKASSGADIRYYGNPQIRDTDESSGGDVRRK